MIDVPCMDGSGCILLFEAYIMPLSPSMPVKRIAEVVSELDTRRWRLLQFHVKEPREQADYSDIKQIEVDETSSKRGHKYIPLVVDLEESKNIFATEGMDSITIGLFKDNFSEHGGDADPIEDVRCDMSLSLIKWIEENFPNAQITFDKFHIFKILNTAVDEVRRQERNGHPELKNIRYIFLINHENLTNKQADRLEDLKLKDLNLKTMRPYQRLNFLELWVQHPDQAECFIIKWYYWATLRRKEPIKENVYTLKRHWDGIFNWFKFRINNGILEGPNSLVLAAKIQSQGVSNNQISDCHDIHTHRKVTFQLANMRCRNLSMLPTLDSEEPTNILLLWSIYSPESQGSTFPHEKWYLSTLESYEPDCYALH